MNANIAGSNVEPSKARSIQDMTVLAFVAQGDTRPVVEEKLKAGDICTLRGRFSNNKDAYLYYFYGILCDGVSSTDP